MRTLRATLLFIAAAATLSSTTLSSRVLAQSPDSLDLSEAARVPAGRNRAEQRYQKGIEMMNARRYGDALQQFEYAIDIGRAKDAIKEKYFVKSCEAASAMRSDVREDEWDELLKVCETAVMETTAQKKAVKKLRAKLRRAFSKNAAERGQSELESDDHDDAQKWFHRAIEIEPLPGYYAKLCESESAAGSKTAKATCKKAAGKLTGDAKKLAQSRANVAGEKPTAKQQAILNDIGKEVWRADNNDPTYARACVKGVKAALKAGVKDHHRVKVDDEFAGATRVANPGRMANFYAPFRLVAPYCNAQLSRALVAPLSAVLESTDYWLGPIERATMVGEIHGPVDAQVKTCREKVAEAIEVGVTPNTVIAYSGKTVTMKDAKAKVCDVVDRLSRDKITEIKAAAKAAEDKELAPFRKALKGDKLKLYERYRYASGRNGVLLKTPKQLKKAKKWFYVTVDASGFKKRWEMTIYTFKGHKLKSTRTKSGWGRRAPSKAYR